jgi:hypothetical protein
MVNNVTNPNSKEYKLTTIVLDIAGHRPFKPVGIKKDELDKRSFLKLSFANKGLGIRRLIFEIVNIEITQHMFVNKNV